MLSKPLCAGCESRAKEAMWLRILNYCCVRTIGHLLQVLENAKVVSQVCCKNDVSDQIQHASVVLRRRKKGKVITFHTQGKQNAADL